METDLDVAVIEGTVQAPKWKSSACPTQH